MKEHLFTTVQAIFSRPLRSLLTILGMFVGVFGIIFLVSIGNAAKNYVLGEFKSMGQNIIIIQPGRSESRSSFSMPVGASGDDLTLSDVRLLEQQATKLQAVTGLVFGTAKVKNLGNLFNANLFGSSNKLFSILTIPIKIGTVFSQADDDSYHKVVVLGAEVAYKLFADKNPLGGYVKINDHNFRVIGVTLKMGEKLGFNFDNAIFIPTKPALRLVNDKKLFGIRARALNKSVINEAVVEIKSILSSRRNGEEDFTVVTQEALENSMNTILNMLTYVLAAIASISIFIAGVSIMNILLVTISERIAEIGIRRAVGASKTSIMLQFILEGLFFSLIGGGLAIIFSLLVTNLLSLYFDSFNLIPPNWIILTSILVSIATGVLFSIIPAYRAAAIDPVVALKGE
jgi:putative ABC transport system permease protein